MAALLTVPLDTAANLQDLAAAFTRRADHDRENNGTTDPEAPLLVVDENGKPIPLPPGTRLAVAVSLRKTLHATVRPKPEPLRPRRRRVTG